MYLEIITFIQRTFKNIVEAPPAVLQYLMTALSVLFTRGVDAALILVLASDDLDHDSGGRGARC